MWLSDKLSNYADYMSINHGSASWFLVRSFDAVDYNSWRRHQMGTFSVLLTLCVGNSPVPGEFLSQRSVTRSFDVFFDLRQNKRLSKPSRRQWFDTQSRSLWCNCNEHIIKRCHFLFLPIFLENENDSIATAHGNFTYLLYCQLRFIWDTFTSPNEHKNNRNTNNFILMYIVP